MNRARRVILDTSTLLSAVIGTGSIPEQAVLVAFGTCQVCACAETMEELDRVLERKKFDRYLDQEARRRFVARIRRNVQLYVLEDFSSLVIEPPCRDPNDNKFLALALAAEAEILVSSDKDLLVLDPWRGVAILTPAEFLSRFKASAETKRGN